MRGFTLIEILVVLGIIALGWCWLPSMIGTAGTSATERWQDKLEALASRARMEAIARQQKVGLAIALDSSPVQISVGYVDNDNFKTITSYNLPPEIAFDKSSSRIDGKSSFLTFEHWDGPWYAVWWYDTKGRPAKTSPTLAFLQNGQRVNFTIRDEGGWIKQK